MATGAAVPGGRYGDALVLDPVRDRLVVFGGMNGSRDLNDLLERLLSGSIGWRQLVASGTPPPPAHYVTGIFDPVGDRLIVFGGVDRDDNTFGTVWALSLAAPAWTELAIPGPSPGPRYGHFAIYDPVGQRMILFGGYDLTSFQNEVWSLSFAGTPAWTQLVPASGITGDWIYHSAILDGPRRAGTESAGRVPPRRRPASTWRGFAAPGSRSSDGSSSPASASMERTAGLRQLEQHQLALRVHSGCRRRQGLALS